MSEDAASRRKPGRGRDGKALALATPATPQPAFLWVADHRALDFLNTSYLHKGRPVETLASVEALADWLLRSGLVAPEDAPALRRVLPRGDGALRLLAQAVDLREWFRRFVVARVGQPLALASVDEILRLNELLAQEESHGRIELSPTTDGSTDGALRLLRVPRWRAASGVLQPLAQVIADLVCHADFTLVRRCEAPDCALLFLDRTKGHRRRWCSMTLCGNRMKAAAFRSRQ